MPRVTTQNLANTSRTGVTSDPTVSTTTERSAQLKQAKAPPHVPLGEFIANLDPRVLAARYPQLEDSAAGFNPYAASPILIMELVQHGTGDHHGYRLSVPLVDGGHVNLCHEREHGRDEDECESPREPARVGPELWHEQARPDRHHKKDGDVQMLEGIPECSIPRAVMDEEPEGKRGKPECEENVEEEPLSLVQDGDLVLHSTPEPHPLLPPGLPGANRIHGSSTSEHREYATRGMSRPAAYPRILMRYLTAQAPLWFHPGGRYAFVQTSE